MSQDKPKKNWGENPIKALVVFEVVGKPKEHVEKTLAEYIEKINDDEHFEVLVADSAEAVSSEDEKHEGLFSAFAEVDIVTDKLQSLWGLCIDYLPASVEIESPEQIVLTNTNTSDLTNDFVNQLHRVDLVLKGAQQKNSILAQNIGTLIQNSILLALQVKQQDKESLSKAIGVQVEQLDTFLEAMLKNNKIAQK